MLEKDVFELRYYKYGHHGSSSNCECSNSKQHCCCKNGLQKVLYILKYLQELKCIENPDINLISGLDVYTNNFFIQGARIETSPYCDLPLFSSGENKKYISLCSISYILVNTNCDPSIVDRELYSQYESIISVCPIPCDDCCCKNDIICYLKDQYMDNKVVTLSGMSTNVSGKVVALDHDVVWLKDNNNYYVASLCEIQGFEVI